MKNTNNSPSCIYGISLGPGNPDLITLQGLKILQKVDKIYFPGSQFRDGQQSSYSHSILEQYDIDMKKCHGFYLEMSVERAQANVIYKDTFERIKEDYNNGFTIAIVSEGDLSTYSSFSYLLQLFQQHDIPLKLVPGISSYSLLAAEAAKPLCLQNDQVIILPRVATTAQLEEALEKYNTVILMKIRSVIGVIEKVVTKKAKNIVYGEYLGTERQFISSQWEEIVTREIPYFSLIILYK